jgi:acyl-CoA reductase-like NAD-dependent aldehyde dehydrogenase
MELLPVFEEVSLVTANMKKWMEPKFTPTPAFMAPSTCEIISEPYGVCLIVGAFNYPITLSLMPLIGALAAGNCVVLKPSEMATKTEQLLVELLPNYLDKECFRVVIGDYKISASLLEQRWDKIFFTGSPRVVTA